MPDRNRPVLWEVDLRLHREEAVDLALGGELGGELLEIDLLALLVALHLLVAFHLLFNIEIINSFDCGAFKKAGEFIIISITSSSISDQ